jgi:hypothetical protein
VLLPPPAMAGVGGEGGPCLVIPTEPLTPLSTGVARYLLSGRGESPYLAVPCCAPWYPACETH